MIKLTLITILTSVSLLIGAIFADGVVIDHNTPQTLQPGEVATVSININKGEVTGFAKLQLEIPAGLTARAIKKSGASFTFSGQKAKFIWMTLPDKQEFDIEYELEANANVNGSKVITGQFSYIKENERVDYTVAPKVINVGDVEIVESQEDQSGGNTLGTNTSNTQNSPVCTRTMTKIADGEYFVEVTAENISSDGFAKIIDDISPGYSIEQDDEGESIVTVEDNQIKFVWFENPADNNYSVSYSLVGVPGTPKPVINGNFSYVSDNAPKEMNIVHQDMVDPRDFGGDEPVVDNTEEQVVTDEEAVADNTEDNSENTANSGTEESNSDSNSSESENEEPAETIADASTDTSELDNTGAEETVTEPISTPETTAQIENPADQTTTTTVNEPVEDVSASNVPDPETGITYKVQLAATHEYITAVKFKNRHNFKSAVQMENHEGWTKFVTGKHTVYKNARDDRNQITSTHKTFNGPFVTAYNNGARITVQEALMISQQKWYQ